MALKFQTNVALLLTFPFGDFRELEGQYGQQFLYTVELAGQRDKLFATPLLHQELQATGLGPGAILTVTKVEAEGNRKGWLVQSAEAPEASGGNGHHPPDQHTPSTAPALVAPPATANGHPPQATTRPDFVDLQTLLGHCLRASWEAWQNVDDGDFAFASECIGGVGITLFLVRARKGVFTQAVEAGLPF